MADEPRTEGEPRPRVSAAEVEMALGGIEFPKSKDDLVDYASSKVPPDSPVLDVIRKLPEREYRTASDVAQAFGELRREEPGR